jgi:hypothetical protein
MVNTVNPRFTWEGNDGTPYAVEFNQELGMYRFYLDGINSRCYNHPTLDGILDFMESWGTW